MFLYFIKTMDLSSGAIKEYLLDTNLFNQRRCEFKLPSGVDALSNMKLLNIGAVRGAGGTDSPYNRGAGVLGLINRIALLDGANVLSECRDLNKQLAFRNLNTSNNNSNSYKTPVSLGASNYQYGTLKGSADTKRFKQYAGIGYNEAQMTDSEASTSKGMLVLSDVLPLLKNVEMLDTKVFRNGLRIVIEWESDIYKVSTDKTNSFTVLEPVLSLYEVVDEALKNEMSIQDGVVSWYEREVDNRTYAPSAGAVSQKFNGFNNKRVRAFLVQKEFNNVDNYVNGNDILGLGKCGSVSLLDESYNMIVGGRQVFPTAIRDSDIARQLSNAFGSVVGYQGFNKMDSESANQFPQFQSLHRSNTIRTGDIGFYGVQMNNELVKTLELSVQRSETTAGKGSNDTIKVFIYADVAKVMSVSGGQYTISYA